MAHPLQGGDVMPASKIKSIPEGYHSVTPYLTVDGAARAIAFYKTAFGATEVMRIEHPDGKIGHAEIRIGDSRIMLSDEFPEMGAHGPRLSGGSGVAIHLYVEDVDGTAKRATAAGAKTLRPVEDKFYGDRMGSFEDPFGHVWHVATHKEDVPPQELHKRAEAAIAEHMKQHAKA
jgi:PhnB protein